MHRANLQPIVAVSSVKFPIFAFVSACLLLRLLRLLQLLGASNSLRIGRLMSAARLSHREKKNQKSAIFLVVISRSVCESSKLCEIVSINFVPFVLTPSLGWPAG